MTLLRPRARWLGLSLLALALVLGFPRPGAATPVIAYTTQGTNPNIATIDFPNGATTPVLTNAPPHALDGIIYDTHGNLIYSDESLGELRRITPGLNNDAAITAFNSLAVPADLALTPDGKSVLVSEFTGGKISSVDLTTGNITPLANPGGNPQGLAFLPGGRLFAILGIRSGGPDSFLAELDPTTGAILHQSANLSGSLDGLTYDPFTRELWATLSFSTNLVEFDPNNLPGAPVLHPINSGGDGIVSDGTGHLFFVNNGLGRIDEYDIAAGLVTQSTASIPGLDDIALQSTPEPSTFVLMGGLGLGMLGYGWYRRKRAA